MQAAYFCICPVTAFKNIVTVRGLPARLNYLCYKGNGNQNKVSFTPCKGVKFC